jgi:hypothetical protein
MKANEECNAGGIGQNLVEPIKFFVRSKKLLLTARGGSPPDEEAVR